MTDYVTPGDKGEQVPARSVVPLPGEPVEGDLAEALGITLDPEQVAVFQQQLDEIARAERSSGFVRCPFCDHILPPGSRIGDAS